MAGAPARLRRRRSSAPAGDGESGQDGVSKRDYYEVLEVTRTATEQEIKSCVPQARAQVPSRSQSRRQGRPKTSSRRRPRPTPSSSIPTSGTCTTASVTPGLAARRRADSIPIHSPASRTFSAASATSSGSATSSVADADAAVRSAAPTCATTWRFHSRKRPKAPKRRSRSLDRPRARRAAAAARRPGRKPITCPQCQGRGQLRYQQGFFTVARTCGQCRGSGSIIAKPCPTCRGAGRVQQEKKLSVRIPAGIATGQRLRLSSEGEAGPGGGPSGDLYVVIHVQDHAVLPARRQRSVLRGAVELHDARARRRDPDSHTRRRGAVPGPGRHTDRRDVPGSRPRHARRQRTRPRRPARHRQGQHASKADQGTEEAARTARGDAAEGSGSSRRRSATRTTGASSIASKTSLASASSDGSDLASRSTCGPFRTSSKPRSPTTTSPRSTRARTRGGSSFTPTQERDRAATGLRAEFSGLADRSRRRAGRGLGDAFAGQPPRDSDRPTSSSRHPGMLR